MNKRLDRFACVSSLSDLTKTKPERLEWRIGNVEWENEEWGIGEWGMGNRKWWMRNEEWGMRNEEWGMRNEEWRVRNEKWRVRNRRWGMGNGEWGMGNGKIKWKIEKIFSNFFFFLRFTVYNEEHIFFIDIRVPFQKRSEAKYPRIFPRF